MFPTRMLARSRPKSDHCRTLTAWWCVLAAAWLAGGCGDDSNSVVVQGKVTYQGQPLSNGLATFFPTKGRPVNVPISEAGEYWTELVPGEYTVIVNAAAGLPEGFQEGDALPEPATKLPRKYTTRARSTLRATIGPSPSEQSLDFDLD
jgi:hypothetical protein